MTAYHPASRLVCSRSLRLAATTALALNTASIAHADEASVRSHPVVKFLQERVIGHALQSATSATINGGLNSYDFQMTSRFAKAPRMSMALDFQRTDIRAWNTPLLDSFANHTFEDRLRLVGKQILQYKHMYPLAQRFQLLAEKLVA